MAEQAIADLIEKGQKAFDKVDLEAIGNGYTEDCILMMEGKDMIRGRENMVKLIQQEFIGKISTTKFERKRLIDCGDYAIDVSMWTALDLQSSPIMEGKFIGVYKKCEDGEWRLDIDSFTSNAKK